MQTVFLDTESLDNGDIDFSCLDRLIPDWQAFEKTTFDQTLARIRDAEIVISNKVVLDRELLQAANKLKLICVAATGTNNVDLQAAAELNIPVCNARGYATPSVVEHVFGLMLNLVRHLPDYQVASRDGRWSTSQQFCVLDQSISELAGKTLGIVGFGELGQAVARLAEALSMEVLIAHRPGSQGKQAGRISFTELLSRVDILSLHCPLTEQNHGLIDAQALALMKPTACLINTARGGLVDEAALLNALERGELAGAALDVLEQEPPLADYSLLHAGLPNLIITPHVAWASRESRQRLLLEISNNIQAFFDGAVRNRVN